MVANEYEISPTHGNPPPGSGQALKIRIEDKAGLIDGYEVSTAYLCRDIRGK
jgi:hypothetical protein